MAASKSHINRLEISIGCPTIEEIHAGFSLFFIQSLVLLIGVSFLIFFGFFSSVGVIIEKIYLLFLVFNK